MKTKKKSKRNKCKNNFNIRHILIMGVGGGDGLMSVFKGSQPFCVQAPPHNSHVY